MNKELAKIHADLRKNLQKYDAGIITGNELARQAWGTAVWLGGEAERAMPTLSPRELAVILSALRYFQANIDEIRQLNREAPLEHFKAGFTFPTAKQIDKLCEKINQ